MMIKIFLVYFRLYPDPETSLPSRLQEKRHKLFSRLSMVMIWSLLIFPTGFAHAESLVSDSTQYGHFENRAVADISASSMMTLRFMENAGVRTLHQALLFFPGVQRLSHDELNIRGAGSGRYNVLLDGRPFAVSALNGRSPDLSVLPIDMFSEVHLARIATPDNPADAFAGSVRLKSRGLQEGETRQFTSFGGLSVHPQYFTYSDVGFDAGVHYTEKVRDDLELAVTISLQQDMSGFESLSADYTSMEFEGVQRDVLMSLAPGLHINSESRLAGAASLNYTYSENTSFYFRSFFFGNDHVRDRHRNIMNTRGDLLRPDTTGSVGQRGFAGYDNFRHNRNTRHYNLHAGSSHDFSRGNINFGVTWSLSDVQDDTHLLPFQRDGVDFMINFDDRTRPQMGITNVQLTRDGTIDYRSIRFQGLSETLGRHESSLIAGNIDLKIPVNNGKIKLGVMAAENDQASTYRRSEFSYFRTLDLNRFRMVPQGSIDVFGQDAYRIPWVMDTDKALLFYRENRPFFIASEDASAQNFTPRNFNHKERIFSGYAMGSRLFGPAIITAGLRVEHTSADYGGQNLVIDDTEGIMEDSRITSDRNYTHLFPNLQVSLFPSRPFSLQLAYTRTIRRPEMDRLSPFVFIDHQTMNTFRGNPDLEPMISNNFDLLTELSSDAFGTLAVNLFYKNISDAILDRSQILTSGDLQEYRERTFVNSSENTELYGVELSWLLRFFFLPGFLSNLGFYTSYSWTESVFEPVSRSGESLRLMEQSPQVFNASLLFQNRRISGSLTYHWSDRYVVEYGDEKQWAPGISSTDMVFMDVFEDGYRDLFANVQIVLSDNFRVWATATNLLRTDQYRFSNDRSLYPSRMELREGVIISTGIRYQF